LNEWKYINFYFQDEKPRFERDAGEEAKPKLADDAHAKPKRDVAKQGQHHFAEETKPKFDQVSYLSHCRLTSMDFRRSHDLNVTLSTNHASMTPSPALLE
jgi:hypothetical protein